VSARLSSLVARPWVRVLLLSVALVLVTLPRFNRADLGLSLTGGGVPATVDLSDAANYLAQVDYYRGGPPTELLISPFAERLLAPWLAARLPFAAMTALNVVNLLALAAALAFIDATLGLLGVGGRGRWLGGALFVFSFPTFYYGAIGLVDPALIAFLAAALYFLLAGRWVGLVVALLLGGLTRETIVLFLPVLVVYFACCTGRARRDAIWLLAAIGATLGGVLLAHLLRPAAAGEGYLWLPDWGRFLRNAARPRAWVSGAITLGLPAGLALWAMARHWPPPRWTWPLLAGWLTCLALFVFAMFTAYVDGRFVWPAIIFTIPIGLAGLWPDGSPWGGGAGRPPAG